LSGTPKYNFQSNYDFSTYSYFDKANDNVDYYVGYSIRAYLEPEINYWLEKRGKTMYDTNSPDMVVFSLEFKSPVYTCINTVSARLWW